MRHRQSESFRSNIFRNCTFMHFEMLLHLKLDGTGVQFAEEATFRRHSCENTPLFHLIPPSLCSAGWEEAVDPRTGKTYYMDHLTKTTHWSLPPAISAEPPYKARRLESAGWGKGKGKGKW